MTAATKRPPVAMAGASGTSFGQNDRPDNTEHNRKQAAAPTLGRRVIEDYARHCGELMGADPTAIITMMHAGSATVALTARLSVAALLCVEESAHGPTFRSFRKAPARAVDGPPMRSLRPAGTEGQAAGEAAPHTGGAR
jgi:hypothetical protein